VEAGGAVVGPGLARALEQELDVARARLARVAVAGEKDAIGAAGEVVEGRGQRRQRGGQDDRACAREVIDLEDARALANELELELGALFGLGAEELLRVAANHAVERRARLGLRRRGSGELD